MRVSVRIFLVGALLVLDVSSLSAQSGTDLSGHWEGSIVAPDADVAVEIDVARNSNGEFTGTIRIPSQNLNGLPLSNFAVDGTSVSFQMKGSAAGERTFKGFLSTDGKSASGGYTLKTGFAAPFTLARLGEARFEAAVRNAPIGKEMEGTWNGTIDAGGVQRQLVLTLTNQPDGTASGSIINVDEGLEIPIAVITQKGSSLTLDVKAVGASYSGVLNTERTELAGTITQKQPAPLTFRRAAAK
jgi:hypothetical protein